MDQPGSRNAEALTDATDGDVILLAAAVGQVEAVQCLVDKEATLNSASGCIQWVEEYEETCRKAMRRFVWLQ